MSSFTDRCQREDEEDRVALVQKARDEEIASDKAASAYFNGGTWRSDYRTGEKA